MGYRNPIRKPNVLAVDDIALMTGLNVRAALTTEEQLEELLGGPRDSGAGAQERATALASRLVDEQAMLASVFEALALPGT